MECCVELEESLGGAPQVIVAAEAEAAVFALPLPVVVSVEDVTEMVAGCPVLDDELLTQRLDAWRTHHRERSDVAVRERVEHCVPSLPGTRSAQRVRWCDSRPATR